MWEFLQTTPAQLVIGLALLAILMTASWAGLQKFRDGAKRDDLASPSDYMSHFRELHRAGELSDEEFKTIKLQLGQKMRADVDDDSAPAAASAATTINGEDGAA